MLPEFNFYLLSLLTFATKIANIIISQWKQLLQNISTSQHQSSNTSTCF